MTTFTVTRNALIPAPAAQVFPLVNDFHEWTHWSPWEAMDPELKRSYSGPDSGVGARYAWSGNRKVGSGNMEIVGSEEPAKVQIRLQFLKPIKATNPTIFTFAPEDGGTRVTWAMTGEHKGLGRIFGLFMNMDKMVGSDFEKGLSSLAQEAARRGA